MINYKDSLKRFSVFLKENRIVLLFGLITSLSGVLIIGNTYSNFKYFIDHRFFISLANNFADVFTFIKSFVYNTIIQDSAESLTTIFNLGVIYKNLGVDSAANANNIFNYVLLILSIIVFFVSGISTYIITFINTKKQSIKELFNDLKPKFGKLFALDAIRILAFSLVFIIIGLISFKFNLNSYLYIIISFTISIIVLYFLYFIYQFALRNILFNDLNLKQSISKAINTINNNKKNIFLNFLIFSLILLIMLVVIIAIFIPISLLNEYFVNIGYSIFNTVGNIFYIIISIIITTIANLFIIRFMNDIYFDCKK